ncbi:MAG: SGNH/GDSL hydrolase family protein, partial [Bacilli bacterium]
IGIKKSSTENIISNIKTIINNIKQLDPLVEIYLQSIYPVNKIYYFRPLNTIMAQKINRKITTINEELQNICKSNNLVYIDVYSALLDTHNSLELKYTIDGLHLNGEGYKVVASQLLPYLK